MKNYQGHAIITEKDVVISLIIDTQNKLTNAQVSERLFTRDDLQGELKNEGQLARGKNQQQILTLTTMLEKLKKFYEEASDETPLADIFDLSDTKTSQ